MYCRWISMGAESDHNSWCWEVKPRQLTGIQNWIIDINQLKRLINQWSHPGTESAAYVDWRGEVVLSASQGSSMRRPGAFWRLICNVWSIAKKIFRCFWRMWSGTQLPTLSMPRGRLSLPWTWSLPLRGRAGRIVPYYALSFCPRHELSRCNVVL